jgi:arginine repressor
MITSRLESLDGEYIYCVGSSEFTFTGFTRSLVLIAASQHMITLEVTAGAAHQIANFNCSWKKLMGIQTRNLSNYLVNNVAHSSAELYNLLASSVDSAGIR